MSGDGSSIRLPKSLYSTGLDAVASKWLKNDAPADQRHINAEVRREVLAAAEALMIAPSVCFHVYGENVVLALLVGMFGAKGVEELLEHRAVEFHLWFPAVGTVDDASLLKQGISPLVQFGSPTTPEYADPEASARAGLTKWGQHLTLDRTTRRRLVRLAAKRTTLRGEWIAEYAIAYVNAAHTNGQFEELGLDPGVPSHELSADQRNQLASLAAQLATTADLIEHEYDLYRSAETWDALSAVFARLRARDETRAATERILALHHLPSIPNLVGAGVLTLADIPRLRKRKETDDFRRWLWAQPNPSDTEAIAQSYIAALNPRVSVTDRRWYKVADLTTMQGVGLALSLLTAPLGPLAGVAANTVLTVMNDRLGDRLSHGRDPRRFATDLIGPAVAQFEFAVTL